MPGTKPWGNAPLEVWISGTDITGGDNVAVTNWPATQAVSGSVNATCTGTFWQATQPISCASLPLPTGASTEDTLSTLNGKVTACNTGAVTVSTCALPTGAATSALQGTCNTSVASLDTKTPALGQAAMAASRPVVIASNQSAVPVSGTFWQATQPVSGTFWQATQPVSGTVAVSNFPASQAVTGTFWQATQPVSAASLPLPSGASTEATLALIKAKTDNLDVALSTRAVTGLTDAQLRASAVPVSAASLPLPTGAATEATLATIGKPSVLAVTATGASGAAVTLTLPAVSSQFHYITHIRIQLYAAAARTGGATPVVVTTTNLPGSLAYTFETAQAIGTTVERVTELSGNPLKSSTVNTATTIVCPVATSGIWRVTCHYYSAA